MTAHHIPVLRDAAARLARGRERIVDATAGEGGHTEAFLAAGADVLAIDRDPHAATSLRERFPARFATVWCGNFGDHGVLAAIGRFEPDLIFLDLGVSSRQLDHDARGFTFRPNAPLDMRMDPAGTTTAADVLNERPQAQLARLFREYADEPKAGRLARAIVRRRQRHPFVTSTDLVNAVRAALGPRTGPSDFARLFQAVRIEVNAELTGLAAALPPLLEALVDGGDLAVITYHSGEDRLVKRQFREWAKACTCPPGQPVCTCRGMSRGEVVTKKPMVPSPSEIAENPRARSAKLRVFRKRHDP